MRKTTAAAAASGAHRNPGPVTEFVYVMRRLSRTLVLSALALTALAAPARAASDLLIGIADDGVTQRSPALGATTIPQWRVVGADVARVMVIWNYVAPGRDAVKPPSGFHASDPNDPAYFWDDIDRTIAQLRLSGIRPIITVTGPAPVWGSQVPSLHKSRYKPDPAKFADFATAVAARYADATDEYILWNEPNIDQWLQPQSDCVNQRCTPAAPGIYRKIANQAIPAIKRADPGARVLFPALAPGGAPVAKSRNLNLKPLPFLRALGCVDAKYHREHTSTYCRTGFTPVDGDGIAYHPHPILSAPDQPNLDPDKASIADLPRLFAAVDAIQKAGGFLHNGSKTAKFNFNFTEFGYETNPPDPVKGVTFAQQSQYVQQSSYIAWRNPRVKMLIQYLWRDDGLGVQKFTGWQSGLYRFDGREKPLRKAFPNPFWVDLPRGKPAATIWGQVRPGDAAQVTVQTQSPGAGGWNILKTLTTNAMGYFSFQQTVTKPSSFRFRYTAPGVLRPDFTFGPSHLITSSAWTVKPLKARTSRSRHHR